LNFSKWIQTCLQDFEVSELYRDRDMILDISHTCIRE
jgi:hypothetical protein